MSLGQTVPATVTLHQEAVVTLSSNGLQLLGRASSPAVSTCPPQEVLTSLCLPRQGALLPQVLTGEVKPGSPCRPWQTSSCGAQLPWAWFQGGPVRSGIGNYSNGFLAADFKGITGGLSK